MRRLPTVVQRWRLFKTDVTPNQRGRAEKLFDALQIWPDEMHFFYCCKLTPVGPLGRYDLSYNANGLTWIIWQSNADLSYNANGSMWIIWQLNAPENIGKISTQNEMIITFSSLDAECDPFFLISLISRWCVTQSNHRLVFGPPFGSTCEGLLRALECDSLPLEQWMHFSHQGCVEWKYWGALSKFRWIDSDVVAGAIYQLSIPAYCWLHFKCICICIYDECN